MTERQDTDAVASQPDRTAFWTPSWTIDELGAQVALALSVDYEGQSNGQIRDIPNRRTIRYYGTLGLLDRPAQMRGRTALYGRRHLMQLVAIKRLQRQGLSLAEVQERLTGATDTTLSQFARLPERGPERHEGAGDVPEPTREPRAVPRPAFWASLPAPVSDVEAGTSPGRPLAREADATSARARAAVGLIQALDLGLSVKLLLEGGRALEPDDLEAIESAAAPLLSLLRARGLAP